MTEYQAPHCDPTVLHEPGTCWACDLFPERQAARVASGALFTSAEANGWHGNVAQPPKQPLFHDWGSSAVVGPCQRRQPRGWRCTRLARGPHGGACASVPVWWNIRDRWRFRHLLR